MRVVHIAFQYGLGNTGGAAIAATRLHQALLAYGLESHYICVHQHEPGKFVYKLPTGVWRLIFLLIRKIIHFLMSLVTYGRSPRLNIVPLFGLESLLSKIKPDVVHVHWINADVCSFEQLSRLPYGMVVNLHDLFMLNAVRPHPRSDRRFIDGFNKRNSTWMERWLFDRKNQFVKHAGPTFIGPSRWVCDECRQSIIGGAAPVFAIPNIIDTRYFTVDAENQGQQEKFVILFGAYGGRRNPEKGFDDLIRAVELLPFDVKLKCELHIFGERICDCEIGGVRTKILGEINDSKEMIKIYCGSDLFAFPSREETQGMVKIEAMLCGLPVVAFDRTACAEGVYHRQTGWIAEGDDVKQFSAGIEYFFRKWELGILDRDKKMIREKSIVLFSTTSLLRQIITVYRQVCNG